MEEERDYPFQGHVTLNEDVYLDCTAVMRQCHLRTILLRLFAICGIIWMITLFSQRIVRIYFMALTAGSLAAYLYQRHLLRSGKAYTKVLKSFNGIVPTMYSGFDDSGIHLRYEPIGKDTIIPYTSVRRIMETEHTLVLLVNRKHFHAVRKYSIRGGSPQELCAYISARAGLRKSAPSRGKAGTIVGIAYALVIAVGLGLAMVKEYTEPVLYAAPADDIRQAAEELESLGITGITPELLEEIEAIYAEFTGYGYTPDYRLDLLCYLGMGEYSDETWEWTPPDSGVFWFDSEAFNVGTMYTDLLRGIRSLDPEALNFSEIEEDLSQVNIELGKGRRKISFLWEGERHSFTAKENYDWMDTDVIDDIAQLVARSGTGKRLYFAWDGGQGFLVFYCNREWANEFTRATGIILKESIRQLNPIF